MIQALTARLIGLWQRNMGYRSFHRSFVDENVYRAMARGLDADLIDLRRKEVRPARELLLRLIEDLAPEIEGLHLAQEMECLRGLVERGSSAERQREVYKAHGNLDAVVDHLVAESMAGLF